MNEVPQKLCLRKLALLIDRNGTTITFYPDPTIFKETIEFDYKWVVNYLRHQAYLTKGIFTRVVDERTGAEHHFTLKVVFKAT